MGRKKLNKQSKFKKQSFSFFQYWIFYYTEKYPSGEEKDFISFIKAKSYLLAKNILRAKVSEDTKGVKVKSIVGYMLHKDYRHASTNKLLSIKDWNSIKKSSFPNVSNFLFKKESSRPEGYTNRYNSTNYDHLKTIGFKKGDKNWSALNRKGIVKTLSERKGLRWTGGKWVKWDKNELTKAKNKIIKALISSDNNRSQAAEFLNINRGTLYRLMHRCESMDWWNKEYPIPKRTPPRLPKEQRSAIQKKVIAKRISNGEIVFEKKGDFEQKRITALKKTQDKKRKQKAEQLVIKVKNALEESSNKRTLAAETLGIRYSTLKAWMSKTKHLVNWKKEYPINIFKNKHEC